MPATLWTIVLAAGAGVDEALGQLCRLYWHPIHTYLRRWGHSHHDAEDLTQDFLKHLLAKDRLARIRRDEGRFRSYLLTALRNFAIDRLRKPGPEHVPIEADLPDPARTPDQKFDRDFTMTLIEHALDRLREDYARRGQTERFEALRQFLPGEQPSCSQAEVGARLGIAEGAVSKAVHDLRRRFAIAFRELVGQTVGSPEEVDDEVRHHLAVLSR